MKRVKAIATGLASIAMLLIPTTLIGEGQYTSPISSKIPVKNFERITAIQLPRASPQHTQDENPVTVSRSEQVRKARFLVTAYTAYCSEGCIGKTKTGYDVSNTIYKDGMRIVAVDPREIKLHSRVRVYDENGDYMFTALAIDTGGAIKGEHIDLLVKNEREASRWGRKHLQIEILD